MDPVCMYVLVSRDMIEWGHAVLLLHLRLLLQTVQADTFKIYKVVLTHNTTSAAVYCSNCRAFGWVVESVA